MRICLGNKYLFIIKGILTPFPIFIPGYLPKLFLTASTDLLGLGWLHLLFLFFKRFIFSQKSKTGSHFLPLLLRQQISWEGVGTICVKFPPSSKEESTPSAFWIQGGLSSAFVCENRCTGPSVSSAGCEFISGADWLGIFGMTATKSPSQFSGAILPYVHQERAAACSAAPPPVVFPYTDATIVKSRFPSWKVENQSQVCSNVCDVSWLPLKIPKCPLKMTFFE